MPLLYRRLLAFRSEQPKVNMATLIDEKKIRKELGVAVCIKRGIESMNVVWVGVFVSWLVIKTLVQSHSNVLLYIPMYML